MSLNAKLTAESGVEHELSGRMVVGRARDCNIRIDDAKVSRAHALIEVKDRQVRVEDLGSTNGTWINGHRIDSVAALKDGDEVRFRTHSFSVSIEVAAADIQPEQLHRSPQGGAPDSQHGFSFRRNRPSFHSKNERSGTRSLATGGRHDLPGSWVNSGVERGTRLVSRDALKAVLEPDDSDRASDKAHLLVVADGGPSEVIVLATGSKDQDSWIIGRNQDCEIVLADASVSERHAQLVRQNERWRIVNLVSANGTFVNGRKSLTTFLSDGDKIELGLVELIFHADALSTAKGSGYTGQRFGSPDLLGKIGLVLGIVLGVVLMGLAIWVIVAMNF